MPNRKINARMTNFEPLTAMKELKSNIIGKFISVKGTVIRVSTIKPILDSMTFLCTKCGSECGQTMKEGKFETPAHCQTCKSKALIPDKLSAVTSDWQRIRIQEIVTDEGREAGRMPRTIECELKDDLVDSCIPGDEVTVTGIVKIISTEGESNARSKNKCLFLLFIDANSVSNSKSSTGDKTDSLNFSNKDLQAVNEIANDPNILQLIVNSVCPAIYGQEIVKMALALALFGGNQKSADEKTKLFVRGDPHVLMVGEPGLGKSQMLQAVSNIAPRGVYVCGSATSTAGLTVTVTKDSMTGDFSLEAGALVLGDQGVCCIDEFDKMGGEQQALLEAMEQQSISVAKAGIVCSLSARSAVIAAANPVGGHYNRAKTVSENLKMSKAIMSRFDVIFILLDNPDQDRDRLLSEHVMALHRGNKGKQSRPSAQSQDYSLDAAPSLANKLQLQPGTQWDPLPAILLRKYIAYARKYCHPKFDEGAKKTLQDFYLSLRKRKHKMSHTPVTTRQLEALIRLAEARAKLELREVVTESDAKDVVELMKESLLDTLTDEVGGLDFSRSSGTSRNKDAKRFVQILHKHAEREGENVFEVSELKKLAQQHGITQIDDIIDSLNCNSVLLMKGNKRYQLATF